MIKAIFNENDMEYYMTVNGINYKTVNDNPSHINCDIQYVGGPIHGGIDKIINGISKKWDFPFREIPHDFDILLFSLLCH